MKKSTPKKNLAGKKKAPKNVKLAPKTIKVEKKQPPEKYEMSRRTYIILAILVVALALFARTYKLGELPPGVYPDEAVNGTDAIHANETHDWRWYYTNNNGREGLFMNLIALGFNLFGVSVFTLKMWSAFFGTLTSFGMILLGEELFRSRRAGIIAGFLTATSFWAVNFSRISFRANMLPFVLVFTIFFLIRGIQKKKILDYVFAGLFFGLGMHTYIAFRIAPIILIVLLIAFILSRRRFIITHWKEILAFVLATIVAALPILLDFYLHPEYLDSRSGQVSVLSPDVNQGHLLKALGISFGLTLAQFNFYGDQNWRHNLPTQPELFPVIGLFFLAGPIYVVYEFFYLLKRRVFNGERHERFILVSLLLAWFSAMLLPSAMTYEGLPHALRSIGAMPVALLLATLSIEAVFKWVEKNRGGGYQKIYRGILIGLIIISGVISLKLYFVVWAHRIETHQSFNRNFKNMAFYLNDLPGHYPKYVITNGGGKTMNDGLPVSAQVIKLLTYRQTSNIEYLSPDFDPKTLKYPSVVVLMSYDKCIIERIKTQFPISTTIKVDPQPGLGTDFTVIHLNNNN